MNLKLHQSTMRGSHRPGFQPSKTRLSPGFSLDTSSLALACAGALAGVRSASLRRAPRELFHNRDAA